MTVWVLHIVYKHIEVYVKFQAKREMSADIDNHILQKYEVKKRLGKGVSIFFRKLVGELAS